MSNSSKLIAENIFFLKNNEVEVNKNINKNQLVTSITNGKTLLMIKKLLLSIGFQKIFLLEIDFAITFETEEAKYFDKNTLIDFLENFDLEFDIRNFEKTEKNQYIDN